MCIRDRQKYRESLSEATYNNEELEKRILELEDEKFRAELELRKERAASKQKDAKIGQLEALFGAQSENANNIGAELFTSNGHIDERLSELEELISNVDAKWSQKTAAFEEEVKRLQREMSRKIQLKQDHLMALTRKWSSWSKQLAS
eukprot:TRINITY_DN1462_c0_g1_i3.p1 TRINITY_DN1462_c0_g1~~TRINITY_DN1462_c0_g1_i3.p1  ORF type:complete len:147 (+),score=31.23 TRINITY_DN1462_c0_g1_i3:65-505(+)